MKTTIRVARQDISQGRTGSARNCPVALAISRATGREVLVSVTSWGFLGLYGERFKRRALPWVVTKFIRAFDRGEPVKPFSFEVET